VRLQALNNGEATAAHYDALGDVMDKLAPPEPDLRRRCHRR
jgi:hypothetical protein